MKKKQVRLLAMLLCLPVIFILFTIVNKHMHDKPNKPDMLHMPQSNAVILASSARPLEIDLFLNLNTLSQNELEQAFISISNHWQPGYTVMLIELMRFSPSNRRRRAIETFLKKQTEQSFSSLNAWYQWLWSKPYKPHPRYAAFKQRLYQRIDKRFAAYFKHVQDADIRLDEVRWGGVRQDGIPPLENPHMIKASDAFYLADTDTVFGIFHKGEARAYPKRIMGWHEMVKDKVAGEPLNGVYCTLCGTMIFYRVLNGNEHFNLGTSGFLYRSNKLMYDKATSSLWSTIDGKPVLGALVGKEIKLPSLSVVTTNWGEWRRRHPSTWVMSLNTGHRRDYGEGVAYGDYFATDKLMFSVPEKDDRLQNKDEVFVLRNLKNVSKPIAIASSFLEKTPLYQFKRQGQEFAKEQNLAQDQDSADILILTDKTGAHRAYETGGRRFHAWNMFNQVKDNRGQLWLMTEEALIHKNEKLQRIPAHNIFWFAWFAKHPNTRLIK